MSNDAILLNSDEATRAIPVRHHSERALDATAFFLADAADGLGPFLIIDLTARRGWLAADAGLAMSMLLLGTVISQAAMGAWIDQTRRKTMAIAVAAVYVAIASAALYGMQSKLLIYGTQFLTGVAVTVFPPALAAISLGLVGRKRLPQRAGRNEACFHAGNVVAALLAIAANQLFGSIGIFFAVSGMAIASAISASLTRLRKLNGIFHQEKLCQPHVIPGYLRPYQLAQRLKIRPHWIYDRIRNGTIKMKKHASYKAYLFPDTPQTIKKLQQFLTGKVDSISF